MRTITTLLPFLLLLFAFTTKVKVTIAGDSVVDTNNHILETAHDYYIMPSFKGEGGGLTVARIGVRNARAVVQSASQDSLGLPVAISSNATKVILTYEKVSLTFENTPDFSNSSTWIVVKDESARVWFVGIGSAEDYPGQQIKKGIFQIRDYNWDYKFAFCSDTNTSSCQDVGIYTDSHKNIRLALNGGPAFAVKFKSVRG